MHNGYECTNEIKYYSDRAMVFDYDRLKQKYDLSIDVYEDIGNNSDDNSTNLYKHIMKPDKKEEDIPFKS